MFRHSWKTLLLICGLITAGSTLVLAKNQLEDIQQLLVQGHFWYARNRSDLAINAWQKVLRAEPSNKEALYGLEEIKHYVPESIDFDKLKQARKLSREGNYSAALELYKAAFKGPPPTSFHAAEYFETLSSNKTRWQEAHRGLTQLVERYPSSIGYRLSLARVESYQEKTRRSAIKRFEMLYQREDLTPGTRKKLTSSWHDALFWLVEKRQDIPRYKTYLENFPDDKILQAKLEKISIPVSKTPLGAFALLDKGKLQTAASGFRSIIRRTPRNADAYEGLGLVRLKQARFGEAIQHLEKAISLDKKKQQTLSSSIADATYWQLYEKTQNAFSIDQYRNAATLANSLIERRPKQLEGLLIRAQIAAIQTDYETAIKFYERTLKLEPNNSAAQTGMVDAVISQGNDNRAMALLQQYGISNAEYAAGRDQILASKLRLRANLTSAPEEAIALLNEAMKLDPSNTWIRLDQARLYRKQSQTQRGIAVLHALLEKQPDHQETLFAIALFQAENKNWAESLKALDAIPADSRSQTQNELAAKMKVHSQYEQALMHLKTGNLQAAQAIAAKMEGDIKQNSLQLLYAELLMKLGETDKALEVARLAIESNQSAPLEGENTSLKLRYAALLLEADRNENTELVKLLQNIEKTGSLTPIQSGVLDRLKFGSALQQADHLLVHHQADEAYKTLSPFLPQYSDDTNMKLALAAINHAQKHYHQSLALYRDVVAEEPKNISAAGGAFGSAMALKEYALAESLTKATLEEYPAHPRPIAQRAQLKLIRGESASARQDLLAAVSSEKFRKEVPVEGSWRNKAQQTLKKLEEKRLSSVSTGIAVRSRGDTNGLDQLEQVSYPIAIRHSLNNSQLLTLGLRYVDLDTGALGQQNSARYGSLIFSTNPVDRSKVSQKATGLAASIKLSSDRWTADIGSTPSNFEIDNIVGGVTWRFPSYKHSFSTSISRRAVKESLLSYSGAFDPTSGLGWGGITKDSGKFSFSTPYKHAAFYSSAEFAQLEGKNVRNNSEVALQAGLRWPVHATETESTHVGLNISLQDFQRDLSGFTLGHGGYFSPNDYLSLTLPLTYEQTTGPLSYRLGISVGVQHLGASQTDIFPESSQLQQQLDILATADNNIPTRHAQAETTSGVYTLQGEIGYSPDRRLFLGGWVAFNNTNNFDETAGGIFLRYFWNKSAQNPISPTIRTMSGLESLKTPEVW